MVLSKHFGLDITPAFYHLIGPFISFHFDLTTGARWFWQAAAA